MNLKNINERFGKIGGINCKTPLGKHSDICNNIVSFVCWDEKDQDRCIR